MSCLLKRSLAEVLYFQIRSDKSGNTKLSYYLKGAGADQEPYNLFVVDEKTGFVKVTGILDREKIPGYNVSMAIIIMKRIHVDCVIV